MGVQSMMVCERSKVMPRCTSPAHFLGFLSFRFFFVAFLLGWASEGVLGNGVDYFANRVARTCVCDGEYNATMDYFPHKVSPQQSKLWNVTYHNNYKLVTDKETGLKSYLVMCGTPVPTEATEADQVIEIPIRSAGIDSGTFFHFFELLGQRSTISYYSDYADYTVGKCIQRMFEEDLFDDVNDIPNAHNASVDVMFISNYTLRSLVGKDAGYPTAFQEGLGNLDYFVLNSDVESLFSEDPFAITEWLEFVSLFLNREEAAGMMVDVARERYECHRKNVAALPPKSVVAFTLSFPFGGNCSDIGDLIVAGSSGLAAVVRQAGGELFTIPADTKFSELAALIQNVDVVIFADDWEVSNYPKCTSAFQEIMGSVNAVKNGNAFDIFKRTRPGFFKLTAFFEGAVAEPDMLLLDVISILHPAVTPNYNRLWLRNVQTEQQIAQVAADCKDIDAPLFLEWNDFQCLTSDGGVKEVAGLEPVSQDDLKCPRFAGISKPPNDANAMGSSIILLLAALFTCLALA